MAEHGNTDEFADELLPPPASAEWSAVQAFRKAKRAELLARRGALGFHDRERCGENLTARLPGRAARRRSERVVDTARRLRRRGLSAWLRRRLLRSHARSDRAAAALRRRWLR